MAYNMKQKKTVNSIIVQLNAAEIEYSAQRTNGELSVVLLQCHVKHY